MLTSIHRFLFPSATNLSADFQKSPIDKSLQFPVLFYSKGIVLWAYGTFLLGGLYFLKLCFPEMLSQTSLTTIGRLQSVFYNALIFGFLGNGILLVSPWILSRLSQVPLVNGGLLIVAGVFWNFGVAFTVLDNFMGGIDSSFIFSIPTPSFCLWSVAYSVAMLWGVLAFFNRKQRNSFVSQWYLIAVAFAFPWICTIMAYMKDVMGVSGVLPLILALWFENNLIWLWLVPFFLSIVYYVIPKVAGITIDYYYFAAIAFGSLLIIASWSGLGILAGSAVPAWIPTVSEAMAMLLFFPIFIILVTIGKVIYNNLSTILRFPALRFVLLSFLSFVALSVSVIATAFPSWNHQVVFSQFRELILITGSLCCAGTALFAALYILLPRVIGINWMFPKMSSLHFIATFLGTTFLLFGFWGAIYTQGSIQSEVARLSSSSLGSSLTVWYSLQGVGFLLYMLGSFFFLINIKLLLVAWLFKLIAIKHSDSVDLAGGKIA